MSWLFFSVATALLWGIAELFYKKGARPDEKYAHLKICVWVGVIMGEYLSSKAGLGYLLVYGGQVFQLNLVMAAIVILCILSGLMYATISIIEKIIIKKR